MTEPAAASPPRRPYSTQVRADIADRVAATVRGVRRDAGADHYTKALLTEEALNAWCERLETLYHAGNPWPVDEAPLPPGRR